MKPPQYFSILNAGNGQSCSLCGALVIDEAAHTSWHAALARILGLEVDE